MGSMSLWEEPNPLKKYGENRVCCPLVSLETGKEVRLIEVQVQPHIEQYLSPTVMLQFTVIESPTYSPDGKAILFVAYAKLKNRTGDWVDDSKPAIYRLTLESGTIDRIANTGWYIRWPSVSPNGKTLTFCAGSAPYDCEYYWMDNVAGSHPHLIKLD